MSEMYFMTEGKMVKLPRRAVIIKDQTLKMNSRIGQEVMILRQSVGTRVWIKTPDNLELIYNIRNLKII